MSAGVATGPSATGPERGAEIVYLSPHLDDVALSCGGQIAARRREGVGARIVTVFAADAPPGPSTELAASLQRAFGLAGEVMAHRREEDLACCARLAAVAEHWPFVGAEYRRDPESGEPLYRDIAALFGPLHPADEAVVEQLAGRLASLSGAPLVVAPLGVGGHVDHLIVRSAAARAFSHGLRHYEDYPYAHERRAVRRAIGGAAWLSEVVVLEPDDVALKIAAIEAFASQLRPLFRSGGRMARRVRAYARRVGGERLWRAAS